MRAMLIAAAVAVAALSASPAVSAATIDAGVRVNGYVGERGGAELDAFAVDSRDTGLHALSGAADDPEGTAESAADVSFATAAISGGERLTADGSTSARAGLPVREAESTSNLTAEFTPADRRARR